MPAVVTTEARASSGSLTTGIAIVVTLLLAVIMLMVFFMLHGQTRQRAVERGELLLANALNSAEAQVRHDLARMRADVRFLAEMPPIAGIARALANDGYDDEGHSSQEMWLKRLGEIFAAYARSDPTVRQVRLIGVADAGRELLRVERQGAFVSRIPDARLQSKSHRPHVKRTLALPPGIIYVSGIELNREHGRIEEPHWATVRVATAASGDDNKVFGIVVINYDADRLLSTLSVAESDFTTIYATNAQGDFVVHPDAAKRFAFEFGEPYRVTDEFPGLRSDGGLHKTQKRAAADHQRYVAMRALDFDANTFDGDLTLFASVDASHVSNEAWTQAHQLLPPLLVAAGLIIALSFAMLRRQLSPLHALVAAARDVAAGDQYAPLPRGYGGEVGELVNAFDAMHKSLKRKRENSAALEGRLRESEAFANAIVRGSPNGIVVVGDDGLIIRSNLAAERMFGFTSEEMRGNPVEMLVPIEHRDAHPSLRTQFDATERARPMGQRTGKLQGQRSDGTRFPAEIALANLQIHERRYIIATISDVAEQRQRQMHSDMLASIVEHSSDFIFICSPLLECLHLNPAACGVVGHDGDPGAARHLSRFLGDAEQARLRNEIAPTVETVGRWSGEVRMRSLSSGDPIETHWEVFAIREADGQPKALAVVAIALADQRARAAAEAASEAKSNFLAHMSHEMRTPLNAVLSVAHLIARTGLDPAQRRLVSQLERAGRHLADLISDVLDLSKIEAGKMTITTHAFALIELLQEAVGLMSAQASEKGIVIALDLDPNLPHEVVGDATRINQILGNLLSNAIKFTERGRVALNATVIDSGDGNTIVEFAVSDTGIGIDGKDIKRLFTPFTQVDDSATRRFGGTGLGLAIVKRLVDAMGGELGVSSEPGRGSRFWCRLMLNRVDGDTTAHAHRSADDELPAVEDAVPPQLPGIRVLVVDDSEINRDVAHQVLQLEGASVWMAANSDEALAILQSRAQQIDVVLMDLQMPGLDGLETTRRIRRDLGLHELPIIALTAAALPIERQRATAAGMQGFLTKPIDPQSMIDQIDRVTGNAGALTPVPAREVMATSNRNWPAIEGIDIDGARARLGGDGELLRSLLSRLFEEYRDLWERDPAPDMIAQPQPLAARMHKLKGAAANLGASRVCEGAAALERALCDGRLDEVERLADTLRTALTGLHEAFAGIRQAGSEPLCGGTTLDSGLLEELVGLLHRHDLAAGNAFQALSKALAGVLDADHFERLRRHLDALEYDAAAAILEALPADGAAATIG
ncbi:MAG: response regulator [Zoogloeaceae bacterium]|nr:response regulator [Rhodocyclaceae bacterium]MCP5236306.1 response regulator [Zoogloeaceae bacterium]